MAETTNAASSPAEVEDVFRGEHVSLAEFSKYRSSGELPSRFKPAEPAESAPADSSEEATESEVEQTETAPDSEPEEPQEPPQKGSAAEKRIKQLLARQKDLERQLSEVSKKDVQPESSPAKPAQSLDAPKKPKIDDYKTYEEYQSAQDDYFEKLAEYKSNLAVEKFRQSQAEAEAQKVLRTRLEEARQRYEDADTVIFPTGKAVHEAKIPPAVRQVFEDSEVYLDLCYVVGSDPDELQKFVTLAQNNPRAALAKVFEYEREIRAELSKPEKPEAETKSGEKAPEPRKTSAPKPPTPVSGGSSRTFDVNDESLSPDEWQRKRTADLKRRNG